MDVLNLAGLENISAAPRGQKSAPQGAQGGLGRKSAGRPRRALGDI
eukprot:SAG11_NODE_25646_length_356_cov_0.595331_1_plen_45_part_01